MTKNKIKMTKFLKSLITFLVCTLSLVSCIFPLAQPTWAHVLASDGSIGAVMHIDPGDEPIAGQPANFYFEFKDQKNKFNPAECNCTFAISENGKVIYSNSLTAGNSNPSLNNISETFTFPQKDVYQLKVQGTPQTPGQFQSFTLNYDVRVDLDSSSAQVPAVVVPGTTDQQSAAIPTWLEQHAVFLVGFAIIILFLFGTFVRRQLAKRRKSVTQPAPTAVPPPTQQPAPHLQTPPVSEHN